MAQCVAVIVCAQNALRANIKCRTLAQWWRRDGQRGNVNRSCAYGYAHYVTTCWLVAFALAHLIRCVQCIQTHTQRLKILWMGTTSGKTNPLELQCSQRPIPINHHCSANANTEIYWIHTHEYTRSIQSICYPSMFEWETGIIIMWTSTLDHHADIICTFHNIRIILLMVARIANWLWVCSLSARKALVEPICAG